MKSAALVVTYLLKLSLLSYSLPIVDPGLFVIMGVRSCRSGTGYCLLGLDCTLDEDFLPDDQGGHCDGLRSAFTPSAHFICCRYNAVNKTIEMNNVDEGDATQRPGTTHEQQMPTDVSTLQTTTELFITESPEDLARTENYEQHMPEEVITQQTTTETLTTENPRDLARTEDYTLSYFPDDTVTETTIIPDSETSTQEAISAEDITYNEVSTLKTTIDSNSLSNRPIQPRFELKDYPMFILTDQGVIRAHPSKVNAEIELKINDDKSKVRSRNVDNNELAAEEISTETTNSETLVSASNGIKTRNINRGDTTTDIYGSESELYTSTLPTMLSDSEGITLRKEFTDEDVKVAESTIKDFSDFSTTEFTTLEYEHSFSSRKTTSSVSQQFETPQPNNIQDILDGNKEESVDSKLAHDRNVVHKLNNTKIIINETEKETNLPNRSSIFATGEDNLPGVSIINDKISSSSEVPSIVSITENPSTEGNKETEKSDSETGSYNQTMNDAKKDIDTTIDKTKLDLNKPETDEKLNRNNNSSFPAEVSKNEVTVTTGESKFHGEEVYEMKTEDINFNLSSSSTEKGSISQSTTQTSFSNSKAAEDSTTDSSKKSSEGTVNFNGTTISHEGHMTDSTSNQDELPSVKEQEVEVTTGASNDESTADNNPTVNRTIISSQEKNTVGETVVMNASGEENEVEFRNESNTEKTTRTTTAVEKLNTLTGSEQTRTPSIGNPVQEINSSSTETITSAIPDLNKLPLPNSAHHPTVHSSGNVESRTISPDEEIHLEGNEIPGVATIGSELTFGEDENSVGSSNTVTSCGNISSHTKNCWLVQFMNPLVSNSSMCVGSYLDSNNVVTSANCVSRMFNIGMTQVVLLSAGGALTPPSMIRDVIVHEEYRNKDVKVLLNDIGLVRLVPEFKMPPKACTLCLPRSDRDLLDQPCENAKSGTNNNEQDNNIGSPMVCSGSILAGVASHHNPLPVYTPIMDYVEWIRANQKIDDTIDDDWK